MAGEPVPQVPLDELGRVAQRPVSERAPRLARGRLHESDQAVGDRPRREPVQVVLVGKFRPNALTVDERAPLDFEEVAAQPPLLDQRAHLGVARVEPVAGEVEGETLHHLGSHEAAHAILRLEQREARAELARTRQAREPAAGDHGVGERHRGTHLLRHESKCPLKCPAYSLR